MRIDDAVKKTFSIISSSILEAEEAQGHKILRKMCKALANRGGVIGLGLAELLNPDNSSMTVSMLEGPVGGPRPSYIRKKIDRAMKGSGMAATDESEQRQKMEQQQQLLHTLTDDLKQIEEKKQQVFLKKYNYSERLLGQSVFKDQVSNLAVKITVAAGASATVVGMIPIAVGILFSIAAKTDEYLLRCQDKKATEDGLLTTEQIENLIKDVLIGILSNQHSANYPDIIFLAIERIRMAKGFEQIINTHYYGAIILIEGIEQAEAARATKEVCQVNLPHLIRTQREAFSTLDRDYKALRDPTPEFNKKVSGGLYNDVKIHKILNSTRQRLEELRNKLAKEESELKILKEKAGGFIASEGIKAKKHCIKGIKGMIKAIEEFRSSVDPEVLNLADITNDYKKEVEWMGTLLEPQQRVLAGLEQLQGLMTMAQQERVEATQTEPAALHPTVRKMASKAEETMMLLRGFENTGPSQQDAALPVLFHVDSKNSDTNPPPSVLKVHKKNAEGITQTMTLGFIKRGNEAPSQESESVAVLANETRSFSTNF